MLTILSSRKLCKIVEKYYLAIIFANKEDVDLLCRLLLFLNKEMRTAKINNVFIRYHQI